jgi:hypothetical protein
MAFTLDSNEVHKRRELYANLMQEIRWRIDSIFLIESQLGKTLDKLQHFIANEYHILQLRLIFEAIALGCMIVHKDISSGKLPHFYQADALIKGLSKIHPDFFPAPVFGYIQPGKPQNRHFEPRPGNFIAKEDIVRLYRKYGEYLHRGTANDFVSRRHDALKPLGKEIGDTARACMTLLSLHTIKLKDSPVTFACALYPEIDVQYYSPEWA